MAAWSYHHGAARHVPCFGGSCNRRGSGERIGRIEDARFDAATGKLTTLLLHGDRALDVKCEQVTLGRDEVLVPEEYARRLRSLRLRESR